MPSGGYSVTPRCGVGLPSKAKRSALATAYGSAPTSSNAWARSIGHRLTDIGDLADELNLTEGKCFSVFTGAAGRAALPMVRDVAGLWRRALPGGGVSEALVTLLATVDESKGLGNFTVRAWTRRQVVGERAVGVDQTNESVIVGDAAVVKWATHLQEGPHPAARRIGVLRHAGVTGMPEPWGLVAWRPSGGAETLVAAVDGYVSGAVDGWTWAVDLITEA